MLIAVISIAIITTLIWLINHFLRLRVCPICAGVSLTWIGMFFGKALGYEIGVAILGMLIGGSVVGIAYQLEKKLPPNRSQIFWKSAFIPSGFVAGYSLIYYHWIEFAVAVFWIFVLIYAFFRLSKSSAENKGNKQVEDLEKKMEQCC